MNRRASRKPLVVAESEPRFTETAPFRLAVIITCWNYAEFVGRAIESVLSQNVPHCELIVIDDGSVDDSWNVILSKGVRAYQIENSGQRRACAFALEKTSSPFILFLDADDELCPNSIDELISSLDNSIAKIQYPLIKIDSAGKHIGDAFPKLGDWRDCDKIQEQILRNGVYTTPPTSGNVFRRDLCSLIEDADYDTAVDGIILFAAPFFGDILSISKPLGLYRIHGRNDSGFNSAIDRDKIERGLNRYIHRLDHLNELLAIRGETKFVDKDSTLFVLQQRIFLNVILEKRIEFHNIALLVRKLIFHDHSKLKSVAISIFFLLLYTLPPKYSTALLMYRYR
ncbi:glycosyltransferase [Bosea sp. BIWAKO-01]|uniref:glycosyltransferase family 2 protein n=1 Tax=Bosea sp. BIWAKO-01 TaxID=506668 RepID=UPI000AAE0A37|nr:glycosyltransferase [Bosea sp. BIWAKO-01]